jgi:hypothetical protein
MNDTNAMPNNKGSTFINLEICQVGFGLIRITELFRIKKIDNKLKVEYPPQ